MDRTIRKPIITGNSDLECCKSRYLGVSVKQRLAAMLIVIVVIFSAAARAQLAPPTPDPLPARIQMDGNGVDFSDGSLHLTTPSASVGQTGAGGLDFFMAYSGNGWRANLVGSINRPNLGFFLTVNVGRTSEEFSYSTSTGEWTTVRGSGATLTYDTSISSYIYTRSDGMVAQFVISPIAGFGFAETIPSGSHAYLVEMTSPNGVVTKINHKIETVGQGYYRRVQSATNNLGYQVHFNYLNNADPTSQNWFRLSKATAINNRIDYCAPLANTCSSLTKTWPSLTFTYHTSGNIASVKDALNRTTEYNYNGSDELTGVEWPSSSSNNVTIGYNGAGRVSSVNRGFGTWTYAYTDGSTDRTTTVTNPESETTTVVSEISTGLIKSVKDGINRTTSYTYDSSERVTFITQPEGNKVQYKYNGRGSVIETRIIAKSGSGLTDLVTSATYPTSCTNPKTCNKPTSMTDVGGHVTNYTYSATHGGVTSIKRATWAGVRPETRYTYAGKQARYKNGASSFTNGGTVYVSTGTSACATTTVCAGGAGETKTTIAYPSSSTANNLQPLSSTTAAGNGAVTATSTFTYDHNGDVQTIDGPLSGNADRARFYYNLMRQQIGVVSPDPDGGGALKFRASKTTYNTDGLPTTVEVGTTTNRSSTALSTFASLEKQETVYDAYNRVKEARVYDGAVIRLVSQVSYDAAGRVECSAQRLNPTVFGALPSSACALSAAGSFGSDRIVKSFYDNAGQLRRTVSAFNTSLQQDTVTTTYTLNGLAKTVTDARGYKTTYDYDGFDRLTKTSFPSKTTASVSSSTDYESITYYGSGGNKGLVKETRRRNGSVYTNNYDTLRRLTSVSAPPDDSTLSFVRDNFNRVTQTTRGGATLTYDYDQLSRLVAVAGQFGSQLYEYDAAGRRTKMTWTDGFYVDYDYDVSGAVTRIRENGATAGAGLLATFTYDDLGRRTQMTRGNGFTTNYSYDGVSRLANLTQNLAGIADDQTYTFDYNPASQITEQASTNASWDWTPDVYGTKNYTANGLNQYITAAGTNPSYDNNGNLTGYAGGVYTYDSANRLKTAKAGTNPSVGFDYDPAGRLLKITSLTIATYFRYDGDDMIAEYDNLGAIQDRYVHGPGIDEPLVWYEGSGTGNKRWLGSDSRGSIAVVTDATGAKEQINTYSPYGIAAPTNLGRFQYTGQMAITEEGLNLYYYKARFYEPELGRFLQTDPIGYGDGMNMYAYVGGDPVNAIDPSGLQTQPYKGSGIGNGSADEIQVFGTKGMFLGLNLDLPNLNLSFGQFGLGSGLAGLMNNDFSELEDLELGFNRSAFTDFPMQCFEDACVTSFSDRLGPQQSDAINAGFELQVATLPFSSLKLAAVGVFGIVRAGASFGKLGTAVANPGLAISGFRTHAVNQAITRGVNTPTLLNTVRNPSVVLRQSSGNHLYLNQNAAVVLNANGQVVTTYGRAQFDNAILRVLAGGN